MNATELKKLQAAITQGDAPELIAQNIELMQKYETFEKLLYSISRSVCLDQKLSGKCICFSCEAKAALGEKQ